MLNKKTQTSWRECQSEYIVEKKKKQRFITLIKTISSGCVLFLILTLIVVKLTAVKDSEPLPKEQASTLSSDGPAKVAPSPQLSKDQLALIIQSVQLARSDKNVFFLDTPDCSYKVTTSIDVDLQQYLLSVLQSLKQLNRGKPQQIAFVVMEADTGKILAMTGFDLDDDTINPCIQSDYPAASIFKVITASAAVQTLGYNPDTQLYFNGNKYTLYKRQLKDIKNKYSYKISFGTAFAESVNPIFGKIGKNMLGRKHLESFAHAFGFNEQIPSELPFFSGSFETNDNEYHLAELGSGFNTNTTISPLFGAMLTAGIINSGHLMLPSIIEHVTDTDGKVIYKHRKATYKTAISAQTASTMVSMMQKTVTAGTAKKSFRGASSDSVLSQLLIGGKTGSLYDKAHTVKYDWFTGFAQEKKTHNKIALSVLVGHRDYIGTRASTYAKMILKQYFKPHGSAEQ
ncbi:MAG: penicillin-binding transpeptidase domain-containing protein [Pseudomonadota bacterium]